MCVQIPLGVPNDKLAKRFLEQVQVCVCHQGRVSCVSHFAPLGSLGQGDSQLGYGAPPTWKLRRAANHCYWIVKASPNLAGLSVAPQAEALL